MHPPVNRLPAACLLLVCLLLACSGCRAPLPPMPPEQILDALRQRSDAFSTIVDPDISLKIATTVEGKTERSPSLGGFLAFARALPDLWLPGLWLHTEKVGHAIFDLKAIGMEFSLLLPQSGEIVTGGPIAYAKLPYLIRPDEVQTMLGGPETLGLSWKTTSMTTDKQGDLFHINVFGALFRTVLVDPGTADILRITDYNVLGEVVTDIRLSDYEDLDTTRFPYRLQVERPLDGVSVDLQLDEPKLNTLNKDKLLQTFRLHSLDGYRHVDLDVQPLSDVHAFTGEK
jgi:hypothetical protein